LTTQDHLALTAIVSLEVDGETPARTKQVYAKYTDITTHIGAESIAMRRVRDHLQDLNLAGVVNAMERNKAYRVGSTICSNSVLILGRPSTSFERTSGWVM